MSGGWLRWNHVVVASVGMFVLLYGVAACLYPGGTKFDHARVGFSVVDNYWCDLLDDPSYGGHANPGRPVGLVAMVVLAVGLGTFWWRAPAHVEQASIGASLARWSGLASAALMPWVGTRLHDRAIDLAALCGGVAFMGFAGALGRRAGARVTLLGGAAFLLALTNYVVWRTGAGLRFLPLIQKAAFAIFLSWIVVATHHLATRGASAPSSRHS